MTRDKAGSESVLGFAFAPAREPGRLPWVALVLKDHPPWAAGKLNGIGGKVEPPEEPRDAMAREFLEEAGVATTPDQWRLAAMFGRGCRHTVYVYTTTLAAACILNEDGPEPCDWFRADLLPDTVLHNVRWLVPLCLDRNVADPPHIPYNRPADAAPAPEKTGG